MLISKFGLEGGNRKGSLIKVSLTDGQIMVVLWLSSHRSSSVVERNHQEDDDDDDDPYRSKTEFVPLLGVGLPFGKNKIIFRYIKLYRGNAFSHYRCNRK